MTETQEEQAEKDLALIKKALNNDQVARKKINNLIEPVIQYQTQRYCKRFCKDNRVRYSCSLPYKPYAGHTDTVLCEWGNASYGWMLSELLSENRLSRFKATNNASFYRYCYSIANSVPFYERWKNWRFARRVYIPAYISELNEKAASIFLALQKGDVLTLIAQNLHIAEKEVEHISRQIIIELTKRKKLYLLDIPSTISLSSTNEDESDVEIAVYDEAPETVQQKQHLAKAWQQLTGLEQFVVEALVLDNQDANDVLNVIMQQNESFNQEELSKIHDRQSLYYFRRKTIEKLSRLMDI